jgi:arabinofuranosyltransferase
MILRFSRQTAPYWIAVLLALGGFVYLAVSLNFVQDDAYISYRYVANYLNGDGLVFNVGERVEGFTNFGWVILMVFIGSLGLDYIVASQLLGFAMGAGIVILSLMMALRMLPERERLFAVLVPLLVGLNMSLAYWSPAGLETAAFAFCVLLALWCYFRRNWFLAASLIWAVWLRPEGGLLVGLIILLSLTEQRGCLRFAAMSCLIALFCSLPMAGFKLVYYGSILPNSFFAKTAWTHDQLVAGLDYTWRFLMHYGFWGVPLLVVLLFWTRLGRVWRQLWLFTVAWTLYITAIGGDVLYVHRFFVPVFPMYALLFVRALTLAVSTWRSVAVRNGAAWAVGLAAVVLSVWLPWQFVTGFNEREKRFTASMSAHAEALLANDDSRFSTAASTIGVFGYRLLGHTVIDLLGLTDSTIARHPQPPIAGLSTTWKEPNYNVPYVLSRAPDYIVFSTGIKPSSPPERALMLYPGFLNCYRSRAWTDTTAKSTELLVWYQRVCMPVAQQEAQYDVDYVQRYRDGLDATERGDHRRALDLYESALSTEPKPISLNLRYQRARSQALLGYSDSAQAEFAALLAADSLFFEAHKELYWYAAIKGDSAAMQLHKRWLQRLVPNYWTLYRDQVAQALVR